MVHDVLASGLRNIIDNTEAALDGRGDWHPRLAIGPAVSDEVRDALVRHELAVLSGICDILMGGEYKMVITALPRSAMKELEALKAAGGSF